MIFEAQNSGNIILTQTYQVYGMCDKVSARAMSVNIAALINVRPSSNCTNCTQRKMQGNTKGTQGKMQVITLDVNLDSIQSFVLG